jgi:hypothetical protein
MEKQKEDRMSTKKPAWMSLVVVVTVMMFCLCLTSCSLTCGISLDIKDISPDIDQVDDLTPYLV